MNKVILTGLLAKDTTVSGDGDKAVLRNALAIQRGFKNRDGVYEADFPSIVAFGQQATFISKYFNKGDGIELEGHIQTGSYTNSEGKKIYTTDVIVEKVYFPKGKKSDGGGSASPKKQDEGFFPEPDDDTSLPFDI